MDNARDSLSVLITFKNVVYETVLIIETKILPSPAETDRKFLNKFTNVC